MAFINRETYEIFVPCMIGDNSIGDIKLFFEVDDLIAPIISILNKKGYYTEYCCQGHPFLYLDDDIIHGVSKDMIESKYPDTIATIKLGTTTHYVFRKYKNLRRSYIKFRSGISLPSIPKGWTIDKTIGQISDSLIIEKVYDSVTDYSAFFIELAQVMNELYIFALSLPDISYNDDPKIKEILDNVFATIPDLTEVEKSIIVSTYKEGNQTIDEVLHDVLNFTGEEIEVDDV